MGRAPCCDKNGLKKGPWTPEEDLKLIDYIQKHGCGNWRILPKNAGLHRCGKSCRLRWTNYLRPDIKRGRISFEEEETIIQLHSVLGNKWSAIAASLPGRTDNELKNYWNTHIRKRLLRMGIDPVTHSPRLDLLDLSSIQGSSLYNSSQMNMLRLLGIQPLLNPELMLPTTTLLSSQHETQNFLLQNGQENQLGHPHIQNQYGPLVLADQFQACQVKEMPTCTALTTTLCAPVSNEAQPVMDHNVEQHQLNLTDLGLQSFQLCHNWQSNKMASNLTEEYVPIQDDSNYYGSDQTITMDPPPSETSTFTLNKSSNAFSFGLLPSMDSSSSTPLNSNSTYISGSNTEDERESYCSNMLKFDIPVDICKFISY